MINSHIDYMTLALQLAKRGTYSTTPNPRVGCVIVNDHQIVGQGWHQKAGEAHAEINAIKMAGDNTKNATVYVTLEPCHHYGKTPPCCDALIAAGVSRIYVSIVDPNPNVSGKSIERLKAAGITVFTGLLEKEATQLNQGFIKRMTQGLPYIRCKLAMSVDGRTGLKSGISQWITSPQARQDVQRIRARSCAIVTGINTILADNPALTVRDQLLDREQWLSKPIRQPTRVIVDSTLQIQANANCLSQPGNNLIVTANENNTLSATLQSANTQIICMPNKDYKVNLDQLARYLANDLACNELLIEAGPTLSGAMLAANLVDELIIYMAPKIIGNNASPLVNIPEITQLSDSFSIKINEIRPIGQDWRITALCSPLK